MPTHLPHEAIEYNLSPAEQIYDCVHPLYRIRENRVKKLDVIPGQVKVIEHIPYNYACRDCEAGVKAAASPKQLVSKSIATAGLLLQVIIS